MRRAAIMVVMLATIAGCGIKSAPRPPVQASAVATSTTAEQVP